MRANPEIHRMQDQNGNSQVSIAGGPLRTNNYTVDGISITDSNNRAVIVPSPEAVQELNLQASDLRCRGKPHRRRHVQLLQSIRAQTNCMEARSDTSARPIGWQIISSPICTGGRAPNTPFKDFGFFAGRADRSSEAI